MWTTRSVLYVVKICKNISCLKWLFILCLCFDLWNHRSYGHHCLFLCPSMSINIHHLQFKRGPKLSTLVLRFVNWSSLPYQHIPRSQLVWIVLDIYGLHWISWFGGPLNVWGKKMGVQQKDAKISRVGHSNNLYNYSNPSNKDRMIEEYVFTNSSRIVLFYFLGC